MNEPGEFRRGFRDVMVKDDPFRLVEPRFEREIRDPGGSFAQLALFPKIVVIRLERDVRAEKFFGKPLQQHTREEPVKVAFVGDDDFGSRQIRHGGQRLVQDGGQSERGIGSGSI